MTTNTLTSRPNPLLIAVCVLVTAALIGIAIHFSTQRVVQMPWYDDWDSTYFTAVKTVNGTLTARDLLEQHNQTRILTTKAIVYWLTLLTKWYTPGEVVASYIGIGLSLLIGLVLAWHQRPRNWLLLPVIGAVVFSLRQSITLYHGIQSAWVWTNVAVLGAVLVIVTVKRRWLGLMLAMLMATWASFTNINGFLLWALLIPLLWWFGWRKPIYYVIWVGVGLATLALYLTGYERKFFFEATKAIPTLFDYVKYILMWLGSPVTPAERLKWLWPAFFLGAALIVLVGVNALYLWFIQRERAYALVWGIIAAFVGGTAALTALGRVALVVDGDTIQPIAVRYAVGGLWAWVALIALGAAVMIGIGRRVSLQFGDRVLWFANLILIGGVIGLTASAAVQQNNLPGVIKQAYADCVRNFPIERRDDCFGGTSPLPESAYFHNKIGEIARLRLSTFIGWQPPADAINADPLKAKLIAYHSPAFETVSITEMLIGNKIEPVIYQVPDGLLEQWISVPETRVVWSAVYEAAIWVHPQSPSQSAAFRLYLAPVGSDERQLVFQGQYDIGKESAPRPFRINLNPFRGQTVRVIYETERIQAGKAVPWAMWVNPRIVLQRYK